MDKQTIELYAPHNAKSLTQEQLDAMKDFSKEELAELAAAYPNTPNLNVYLVLKDKRIADNKQVYPLSTWKNLYELLKMGNSNFIAISYKSIFKRKEATKLAVAPTQDLTKQQVKDELGKKDPAKEFAGIQSAAQIAEKEGGELVLPLKFDKPLNRMNKEELATVYAKLYDKAPDASLKNAELIKAIGKKNK